jgi:hypothetical protein
MTAEQFNYLRALFKPRRHWKLVMEHNTAREGGLPSHTKFHALCDGKGGLCF